MMYGLYDMCGLYGVSGIYGHVRRRSICLCSAEILEGSIWMRDLPPKLAT